MLEVPSRSCQEIPRRGLSTRKPAHRHHGGTGQRHETVAESNLVELCAFQARREVDRLP